MTADRSGGRAARVLSALLAFVLLGLAFLLLGSVGHPAGPPSASTAPAPAHGTPAGDIHSLLGDTGGSPAVLPPPSRIHVVVNRGGDGPGAPSVGAAATPAAAVLAVRAINATPNAPSRGDEPTAGTVRGRAPPLTRA